MPLRKMLAALFPPSPKFRDEKDGLHLDHWAVLEEHHDQAIINDSELPYWKPKDPVFWVEHLTRSEHGILIKKGTEAPNSSPINKFYPKHGYFACKACGLPLYTWQSKFDSGTGWPSFGEHIQGNVLIKPDFSLIVKRTECICRRCHSHLGHVFAETNQAKHDRLRKFNERQCINGVCLKYVGQPLSVDHDRQATHFDH